MTTSKRTIEEKLQALRLNYIKSLPEKFEEIQQLWRQLQEVPDDRERLTTLHRHTHTLAGSGGTFGCQEVGSAARQLSNVARQLLDSGEVLKASEIGVIEEMLALLGEEIELVQLEDEVERAYSGDVASSDEEAATDLGDLIYILTEDGLSAEQLAAQIAQFGYRVKHYQQAEALLRAVAGKEPQLIIADILSSEGMAPGIETIRRVQLSAKQQIPVIFVATSGDFQHRVDSVRVGAVAYFEKPVDLGKLVDRIDAIVSIEQQEPFRVLIVEDAESQAEFYALTLQQHGMMTVTVNDPMAVLEPLHDFNPDLVLTDMYMPGCSGIELAAVIRQQSEFVSLPIVFLSSEESLDTKLTAMSFGGDDFLSKPIRPDHLVSAVRSRTTRYRAMRSLMLHDSLTGLFNHTTLKEQLDNIISRAGRYDEQVVFAMIDLDHFKQVNDHYGHMVGDRVIKSISRLLKQRMRRSDVVGRYGGEEFAVILPGTPLGEAEPIFDSVREAFAQIAFPSEKGEFHVTFSCGLAAFPDYDNANTLSEAADRALYRAKGAGRNRVESV